MNAISVNSRKALTTFNQLPNAWNYKEKCQMLYNLPTELMEKSSF